MASTELPTIGGRVIGFGWRASLSALRCLLKWRMLARYAIFPRQAIIMGAARRTQV